jgi:hypothetical protein
MSADPSVAGRVQASVQRSIASEVIYGAARMVAGLLAVRSAASSATRRTPRRANINTRSPPDPTTRGEPAGRHRGCVRIGEGAIRLGRQRQKFVAK